eukprot:11837004-Ditylum_brightwellii.AAC.1
MIKPPHTGWEKEVRIIPSIDVEQLSRVYYKDANSCCTCFGQFTMSNKKSVSQSNFKSDTILEIYRH